MEKYHQKIPRVTNQNNHKTTFLQKTQPKNCPLEKTNKHKNDAKTTQTKQKSIIIIIIIIINSPSAADPQEGS
jgi:hypothetical protein